MQQQADESRYPPFLGEGQTLENGYIISRDEQGNITHIIDAEYSWQVTLAMIAEQEEAYWPSIDE